MMKLLLKGSQFALAVSMLMFAGCASNQTQARTDWSDGRWLVLPILNYAETPLAGEKAEALVFSALRAKSSMDVTAYSAPVPEGAMPLLEDRGRYADALRWAFQQDFVYGVTGSVEEWRYKSGLDGEPAVGISLRVIDIRTGDVLWSGSRQRSGWSRQSVSGTAQKVISQLVKNFTGD